MVGRMLTLAPTESCSLWTTMMVAPVLAMNTSPASHYENWTEAGNSDLGAGSELATSSWPPLELISDTSLTDGILGIVNEHVRDYPDKRFERVFKFTVDRVDEESNTLTQTISCRNPPEHLKSLAAEIDNGFGLELDRVEIIVKGTELEMRYRERPLFGVEIKAAERYIKYAVHVARSHWLTVLQRQLRINSESEKKTAQISKRLTFEKFKLDEPAEGAAAYRIRSALSTLGKDCVRLRIGRLSDDELASDWGQKLTGELIQIWFDSSVYKIGKGTLRPFKRAFKCSGSSTEDISTKSSAGKRRTVYARIIKDYIRSQLGEHTSPDGQEPAVIIRMTDKRDMSFLMGPSSEEPYIPFTGKAEGMWVSISNGDESGPRITYLCQSSSFHAAFSDFLRANYKAKSGNDCKNQGQVEA